MFIDDDIRDGSQSSLDLDDWSTVEQGVRGQVASERGVSVTPASTIADTA